MALKAILDSLDSVDAALHDFYAEKDGKFVLQIEGVREHPDVTALSNALTRVRTEKTQLAEKVSTLETRLEGLPDDFDADQYEDLRARADGAGAKDVDERIEQLKAQHERRVQSLETKHQNALAKVQGELDKKTAQIERSVIDGGLLAAMDEANIDPRHKKKLAPYLRSLGKVKLVEEGGELVALVETDMGDVAMSKFVADWAGSDDGKEYVSKASGLDSKGSDNRRMEGNPFAKGGWNKTEQGRLMSADRAKAERFAKAAGFKDLDAAARAREPLAA